MASQVSVVIDNLKAFKELSKHAQHTQNQLITYYKNNQERMDYQLFTQKGFIIRPGAIESAHRTVIQ